jgi:hypothetical protein
MNPRRLFRPWSMVGIALLVSAALHAGAPRASWACACCACDFGGGDVECGDFDADCGICIVIGGMPAASCSICDGDEACSGGPVCTAGGQTLCSGDPNECSTGITGACCPGFFGVNCFELTAAGCGATEGMYHGDESSCSGVGCLPNGAACTDSGPCASTFCANGVCCDTACAGSLQQCNLPDAVGTCTAVTAPAPALSDWALLASAMMLAAIALLALLRRRVSSRA